MEANTHGFIGAPGAYQIPPELQHGGREFYVCNRSGYTNGSGRTPKSGFPTITRALQAAADSPQNDGTVVHVLAGHNEAVSSADFLSALSTSKNIKIIGHHMPKLRWTATGSTLLMDAEGFEIRGFQLELTDSTADLTVAAPITITGSRCKLIGNLITVSFTAARLCTLGINVSTAADDCEIAWNTITGVTAGTPTDVLKTTAAVLRPNYHHNDIQAATSATTVGPIRFTAAAVEIQVKHNSIIHRLASSTECITGVASLTGVMAYNQLGIQNATGAATAITTPASCALIENYATAPGKAGLIVGTVSG